MIPFAVCGLKSPVRTTNLKIQLNCVYVSMFRPELSSWKKKTASVQFHETKKGSEIRNFLGKRRKDLNRLTVDDQSDHFTCARSSRRLNGVSSSWFHNWTPATPLGFSRGLTPPFSACRRLFPDNDPAPAVHVYSLP